MPFLLAGSSLATSVRQPQTPHPETRRDAAPKDVFGIKARPPAGSSDPCLSLGFLVTNFFELLQKEKRVFDDDIARQSSVFTLCNKRVDRLIANHSPESRDQLMFLF